MSRKVVLAAGIVLAAVGGAVAQNASNTYRPEWYYQTSDGADWGPAIDRAQQALAALPNGGTLQLSCGKTYTVSSVSSNGRSLIQAFSNVDIVGCGHTSVLRMADGVYTSSAFFPRMIANTTTLNNVRFANFTIDMNGSHNSCSGSCWAFNAAIEAPAGNDITVENVRFINNPGSNNTVFGSNVYPPTVTNLKLIGNIHEHNGDIVNSASTDWSGDFFIASNVTYSNIRHSDGPRANGSAFEMHGAGVTASDIVVSDYFNCGIIANEAASTVTNDINVGSFKCSNVKGGGIQIYSRAGATNTNVNIHDGVINFLSGSSGMGIDACSVIDPATGGNINLSVDNVQIRSDVVSNLGNEAAGVCVGRWRSARITNNQFTNTQGPAIRFIAQASGAALQALGNQIVNPGWSSNAALQAGIVLDATAGVTTDNISIAQNPVTGTVRYSVINAQNSVSGTIFNNIASGATVGQVSNSGSGVFVFTLPGGSAALAGVDIPQSFTAFQQFSNGLVLFNGQFSMLHLAAPANPVAGTGKVWFDGADLRLHEKNVNGVVGTTVVADSGSANNFLTGITAAGVITKARPTCASLSDAGAFCNGSGAANLTGTLQAAQEPAHTGDVTNTAGSLALTLSGGNAGNLNSGTLLAARMPALTGDCTTSVGAVATTCSKINGVDQTAAWTTYAPTVTASTPGGTPPTFTVNNARYRQIGKTVIVVADVTVTAAGTGSGFIQITLPVPAAAFRFVGSAYEYSAVGINGISFATNSGTWSARSGGAAFIATGQSVIAWLTYEAA